MSEAPKKSASGAVAIEPWRPSWKVRASKGDAQEFLSKIEKPEFLAIEEPTPV
jgi:hypothetical protein